MNIDQTLVTDQYSLSFKAIEWLREIFANAIILSDTEYNAGYFEAVLEVWEMLGEGDQQILFTEDEREIAERLKTWLDTRIEKGDDAE